MRENISCRKPTIDNPYMNYTLGEKPHKACVSDENKQWSKYYFRTELFTDTNELWGKYIWDRPFYTMPNTNNINNQVEFAKWCYDMDRSGQCKILGVNCVKYHDIRYNT